MQPVMKFQVAIPERTFWQLAERAELLDMRVPDYLADLAMAAAVGKVPTDTDPVVVLVRQGLTDREIARELGWTNLAVATRRRQYGMPANRRGRKEGE